MLEVVGKVFWSTYGSDHRRNRLFAGSGLDRAPLAAAAELQR